jgi:hypothetical protein
LAYSVWDRVELRLELHCRRTEVLYEVGLRQLFVHVGVADVEADNGYRPRATVAWERSAELRLVLAGAQVGLELRLAVEAPLLDVLGQPSLLNDALRLNLAHFVAEPVYAPLIAGVVVINPVLAAHRRVEVPAKLAQPVDSGSEPGADFGRLAQALLHDVIDFCQTLVDRDGLTFAASTSGLTGQQVSSLLLPL